MGSANSHVPEHRDDHGDTASLGQLRADRRRPIEPPAPLDDGDIVFVRFLGAGGMGEVWECRQTSLARSVAVKELRPAFAHHPDRRARNHEALAVSSLLHPAIPQVYRIHEESGRVSIQMELVPGVTLAERIRLDGPLSAEATLELLPDLAGALHAAHQAGITHRDVKPANIHVLPRDPLTGQLRAKLLDWGLALGVPQWRDEASGADPFRFAGTPEYMAPEQVRGKAQASSDIWSLGCVLFECLAGAKLFRGPREEVLYRIAHGQVDLTGLPPRLPAGLRAAIEACLRPDPHQRLQAVGDVISVAGPGARGSFAAMEPRRTLVTQLPPAGPSEVDRRELVDDVLAALHESHAVALGGGVGVGKSWIAQAVARRFLTTEPAGSRVAVVIPLGQLADASSLPAAIGQAIGESPVPNAEALRIAIEARMPEKRRGTPLLLVLDDIDRVRHDAEPLCRSLRRIEGLALLATSRSPVELVDGAIIDVPPLACAPLGGDRSARALASSEAMRYLLMRVRGRRRRFAVTSSNAEGLAAICERLSGVPLALNAAAAALRTMEPEELRRVLERQGIDWEGERGIAWCVEGAPLSARLLLERLTVFAGSWSRDLAQEVCGMSPLSPKEIDRGLNELVARSLVHFEPFAGRSRYRVPEIVRSTVRRGVSTSDRASLAHRHAEAVASSIASCGSGDQAQALPPVNSAPWLDVMDLLATDAEEAIRWSLGPGGSIELGCTIALVLQHFWFTRARYHEGARLVEALLEARAKQRSGRCSAVDDGAARDAANVPNAPDVPDVTDVRLHAARSKLLFRVDGQRSLEAIVEAHRLHAEIVARQTEITAQDKVIRARLAHNLGLAAMGCRSASTPRPLGVDVRAAILDAEEAWRALGSDEVDSALLSLGQLELYEGQWGRAAEIFDGAIQRYERLEDSHAPGSDPVRLGTALAYRGRVALATGDTEVAGRLLRKALVVRRGIGELEGVADSLLLGGAVALARGDAEAAGRLFGAAESRRVRAGTEIPRPERSEYDAALERCRKALGNDRLREVWSVGAEWSDEEAALAMP